jgi:trk system potassium uptake protein
VASARSRGRGLRHPERLIAYSFAAAIAGGTGLLMLPFATATGDAPPLVTAVFTSTSAVCVTGLAAVDTGSYWSGFGQVVILALIQIGGLGIMTLATLGLFLLGRRVGLRRRVIVQADAAAASLAVVRRLALLVGALTLAFEAVGTAALAVHLWWSYGYAPGEALWQGLFHAVSAFNNAGFGLLPTNLMPFVQDFTVNVVVMALIVAGGLGFPVWLELRDAAADRRRMLSVHAKLMLIGTAALIVGGALVFLAFEWSNPATLGQFSPAHRVLPSLFQSVTPRTAGFNTIDYGQVREQTLVSQMMLMFVGAGPASTGGGIKVTSFLVLILFVLSEARGEPETNVFGRRLPVEAIRQAFSITFIAANAIIIGAVVILAASSEPFIRVVFEAASAFGTVGLSTGITPHLDAISQYTLSMLMYLGRVGPYTLAVAFALRQRRSRYRYAAEAPLIG